MISFSLNGQKTGFAGDPKTPLLTFLREEKGVTSAKDGCSGQAACGACLVEIGGQPALACGTPISRVAGHATFRVAFLLGSQNQSSPLHDRRQVRFGLSFSCATGFLILVEFKDQVSGVRREERKDGNPKPEHCAVEKANAAHLTLII